MAKILIISGSARRDSVNRKLAQVACGLAAKAGADAEFIDPLQFDLPLFNQDLEEAEGLPAVVRELKAKFVAAQGLIFCSPEYNSSVTPLLKNLIDWVSRTETDDEPSLAAYRGKAVGLLAASPGALGGLRGLVHLRAILGNVGCFVVPNQHALSGAYGKFDDAGNLTDAGDLKRVEAVVSQVVETATLLNS